MSNAIANQLYLAYLGRPSDTAWRSSTTAVLAGGAPSVALQNAFYSAAVLDGAFSLSDSSSALVNKIFLNVFGFAASTFEQNAWAVLINNGTITTQTAAWTIFASYLGATNVPSSYQQPAQSKLLVIDAYTNALANDSAANLAVSQIGSSAAVSARSFITTITSQATAAPAITGISTTVATVSSSTTGSTFTLTTNTDTFTGTSANDLFNGTEATLGLFDKVDGANGTDTLFLALTSATNTLSSTQFTGIETVTLSQSTIDNAGNGVTLGMTGVTSVGNNSSAKVFIVSGLTSVGTASITNVSAADSTFIYSDASVAGTSDALTLNLSAATGNKTININSVTTDAVGIERYNVVSAGSANSVTLATNDTNTTTVAISGSVGLTAVLGTNFTTTATTVTAASATGNVSLSGFGAAVHTVTGGSGADTFTFAANYIGGASGATRDIIDGGAGRDTLNITLARAVNTVATAAQSNLTSIEILELSDKVTGGVTVDVTKFTGVDTLNLNGADGADTIIVNSGSTIALKANTGDGGTTISVTGTGTSDSVSISMAGFDFDNTTAETFSGVETLNISTGTVAADTAVFGGALTMNASAGSSGGAIIVTGTSAMTFTGVVTAASIDASALTGILTVTGTPANAITIRGGTAADVITGSAVNDLIVGGNGADVITMGAGNDSIDLTETTAAIDKVVFATVANTDTAAQGLAKTGLNTITAFGTTDTLNIAGLGDGSTTATGLTTISAPAAQAAFTDDAVTIINVAGTAAALTTGGTATVTDFTNMTQVAAFFAERFTLADANQEGVIVWNQTGTTYIYQVSGDGTAGFQAADVALVGTVAQTASLATANLVYA